MLPFRGGVMCVEAEIAEIGLQVISWSCKHGNCLGQRILSQVQLLLPRIDDLFRNDLGELQHAVKCRYNAVFGVHFLFLLKYLSAL